MRTYTDMLSQELQKYTKKIEEFYNREDDLFTYVKAISEEDCLEEYEEELNENLKCG